MGFREYLKESVSWIMGGVGKVGLDKLINLSKKNKTDIYLVTDDNHSNIGNFYLRNGKFAVAKTMGNPEYDFSNNKTNLKPKSDIIYKAKKI